MQNFDRTINAFLAQKNVVTDLLDVLEQKTKVKKLLLVYGFIALIGLYLVFGYGSMFLANFIGFIYPAYSSIKAIESKAKDDDTKWLTYWVVFAAISLIEVFTDILLFWIPLYSLLKCVLFLFLMAPVDSNGSLLLYTKVIRPYFLKYEAEIDQNFDKLGSMAADLASKADATARLAGMKTD